MLFNFPEFIFGFLSIAIAIFFLYQRFMSESDPVILVSPGFDDRGKYK